MNESRLWGALGILLALLGFAAIAGEFLGALGEGLTNPMALYGIGVLVAAVLAVLIVGPSVAAPE